MKTGYKMQQKCNKGIIKFIKKRKKSTIYLFKA